MSTVPPPADDAREPDAESSTEHTAEPIVVDETVDSEAPIVVDEPVIDEPVIDEPVVAEPAVEEPVFEKTVAEETVVVDEPTPLVEPSHDPTPVAVVDEAPVETAVVSETAAPVAAEEVPASPYVAPAEAAPVQTVYVSTPTPPSKKGNRGYGVLFALLGTIVFAALFAGILALILLIVEGSAGLASTFGPLMSSSAFIVPVVVVFVVFVLLALIINRGGWASWVLGSLLGAVAVYFTSIGAILLVENVVAMTPEEAALKFEALAVSAPVVVAAVLSREVIMWFGAAIAARGRKVKARNLEARAAYERELADSSGQYVPAS